MSSRDSLQRARRLGNLRWQGWDPATHHAMTRLLHIIQQTAHKLPDTTVILPGCHKLVQIRIQSLLDVTLRCCMWHQCHSKCWTTPTKQHSIIFQSIWILKKPTIETQNLTSHRLMPQTLSEECQRSTDPCILPMQVKANQSHYRPGVVQRVPGS